MSNNRSKNKSITKYRRNDEKGGVMNNLRDVEIEDLLGRDTIKLDNKNITDLIKGKMY